MEEYYLEDAHLERPDYTWWNRLTETVKYLWEPGKTCKNEIMRGDMSSSRIREVLSYGLDNKDSWGRPIITEESLKFLYRYNKNTVNKDSDLKTYIRNVVKQIRRENPKTMMRMNDQKGVVEEYKVNCLDVEWLDEK